MIIHRNGIRTLLIRLAPGMSLFSVFLSGSVYADLTPPSTLKTAVSGTRTDIPQRNAQFLCIPGVPSNVTLQQTDNFWLNGTTLSVADYNTVAVSGNTSNGVSIFKTTLTPTERHFKGNGIPNHKTGVFPVQPGTPAYQYYASVSALGYPNAAAIPVQPYDLDVTVLRDPVYSETPYCINSLVVGIATQTGARWDANIALGNYWVDPVAALPLDECWGHPYSAQYHYHGYSWKCFPNTGSTREHSPLFGYALDGFGIYGPRGEKGKLVTNADLDECHGHKGLIKWDGVLKVMYHYHLNNEFPYGPGCFRGPPASITSFLPQVHNHGIPIPPEALKGPSSTITSPAPQYDNLEDPTPPEV